jgi:CysZ protein
MINLFAAFSRALRELSNPGVLWLAIWPALLSVIGWLLAAGLLWAPATGWLATLLPVLPWSGWEWLSQWAAGFLFVVALSMATYVTILMLVAVVTLPLLIKRVASGSYPELMPHGERVFVGSLANTLIASFAFLFVSVLSLPLLLIPGAIFLIPLVLTAWVNQRTFRFDALAEHATRAELTQLVSRERMGFYGAGVLCALLAHVPIVNLLVPSFTALVFVHFGLGRLRELRQQQGVQL